MTKEEEFKCNASVRTIQFSLEMMMNRCIAMETELEMQKLLKAGAEAEIEKQLERITELENELDEYKEARLDRPEANQEIMVTAHIPRMEGPACGY